MCINMHTNTECPIFSELLTLFFKLEYFQFFSLHFQFFVMNEFYLIIVHIQLKFYKRYLFVFGSYKVLY